MKSSNTTTDELLLYAVTDRAWLGNETLYEQVEKYYEEVAVWLLNTRMKAES